MRAVAFLLLAACGAQPNQPALANVPKPNTGAVAGGAAAAAAAITLASPDSHNPEKKQDQEKKPMKVKENVPSGVLDRLDKAEPTATKPDAAKQPAGTEKPEAKPRDALDFGGPK
jgi:hypothetical protein